MSFFKKLDRSCRRNATPLLCCLAAVIILGSLLYLLAKSTLEGFEPASEFIFYHMNGCPHCTNMMPEWSTFVSNNNTSMKTRKVEQSEAPEEIKKHGISGFPALLLLDGKGNKVKTYDGPRTANSFASFVKQHLK